MQDGTGADGGLVIALGCLLVGGYHRPFKRSSGEQFQFGYPTNETGFGWTNACMMELLDYLGCLGDLDVEQTFTAKIQLPPRTPAE